MTDEELAAIRWRNQWRKNHYYENQAPMNEESCWTVGADNDIDALLAEVDRLRHARAVEDTDRDDALVALRAENERLRNMKCECGRQIMGVFMCPVCDNDE